MTDDVSIILPSYKPDEKLLDTVKGLCLAGFDDIIVIDDGGGDEFRHIFDEVRKLKECTVLVHPQNRGKGAALKTAFDWYMKNRSGAGAVTVDGDGQHRPEDVRACAERMLSEKDKIILGVRDFSLPDVPERSRKGNRITSGVFRIFVGMLVSDTQTGLRAVPSVLMGDMCSISGDRYEYETNMLLYMKRHGIGFDEVKISTVYIDENETSHFRPVRDSVRIYSLIIKFILTGSFIKFLCSSGICFVIDYALFALIDKLFHVTPVSYAGARAVSSLVNFFINRRIFKSGKIGSTILKYYGLALIILGVGTGAVTGVLFLLARGGVSSVFGSATVLKLLVKLPCDALLFILSYNIQKKYVFKKVG